MARWEDCLESEVSGEKVFHDISVLTCLGAYETIKLCNLSIKRAVSKPTGVLKLINLN